jgi:hypothetical protein
MSPLISTKLAVVGSLALNGFLLLNRVGVVSEMIAALQIFQTSHSKQRQQIHIKKTR